MNICVAYSKADITSNTTVSAGSLIVAGNDASVTASMQKSLSTKAAAAAYQDGSAAAGIAVSLSTSDTTAQVDGTIDAGRNVTILADSKTEKNRTSSSSGVGTGIGASLVMGLKDKTGLNKLTEYFRNKVPGMKTQNDSTTKLALSAAFAFADHANNATADVGSGAVIIAHSGLVDVHAHVFDAPQNIAISTIDSSKIGSTNPVTGKTNPKGNTKDNSVSAAVAVGLFHNNSSAYVSSGGVVDGAGSVRVYAETRVPYDVQWLDLAGLSDITDKLNSNAGAANGLFTSWAQSNAQGSDTSIAGSVDFFKLDNTTNSYIDSNAKINANRGFDPSTDVSGSIIDFGAAHHLATSQAMVYHNGGGTSIGGLTDGHTYYVIVLDGDRIKLASNQANATAQTALTLTPAGATGHAHYLSTVHGAVGVLAKTEVETANLSGVFGLKFFGSSSGGGWSQPIGGLVNDGTDYASVVDSQSIRLARTALEAQNAPATYFNPSTAGVVNSTAGLETIDLGYVHGFRLGDRVTYDNGGGASIGGLVDGQTYYAVVVDGTHFKLADSVAHATALTPTVIDLNPGTATARHTRSPAQRTWSGMTTRADRSWSRRWPTAGSSRPAWRRRS